jgi:transposase
MEAPAMIQTFDSRSHSNEVMAVLRQLAINARLKGHSNQHVADILDLRPETVSRWWSAYQENGEASLPQGRTGRPVGTGRKLTEEQERQIQRWIADHAPEDLQISSSTWTRAAVRKLILQRLGIKLAIRTVGEYLSRWGFTPQRPARRARKQDPEEVRQWKEEDFPELSKRASQEGASLQFADETGASLDDHGGRSYSPRGRTPIMPVSGNRGRINVISSISREGDVFFLIFNGTMNGGRFIGFLQALIEFAGQKVILVADHHPTHDSAQVRKWLDEHQDEIEVHFLPKYAPELNADEYLNNDMKESIAQEQRPDDVPELRTIVERFLNRLTELPDRVASYFRHPAMKYAAG